MAIIKPVILESGQLKTAGVGDQVPQDFVQGLGAALDGKAATTDSRFTNAREWSAATISQAEAETGTASTRRAWTAQRVRQAIVAWFNGISGALGRTILSRTTAAQVRSDIGLKPAAIRDVGLGYNELLDNELLPFAIGTANLPRLPPTLNFNFMKVKHLDPRIQFSRASKDWGFDAEGNYREFDINQPIFDYDLLTGEPLGIRVWPQRTYMLPNSATFSDWPTINESTLIQTGVKNKYGDSVYKLARTLGGSPILRRPMVFSLEEQELVLVCEPSDLPCVMVRVVSVVDMRVTVNMETLGVSTQNISEDSVKVRRLGGKSVEVRVIYTPIDESGRHEIWAKRDLDVSVGVSDIIAGEHIFISSCFVCNQLGAPYVRTEGSQVTVSSQHMHLDMPLGNGKGTYLVDALDLGQISNHVGLIHIKRSSQDTYGAAILSRIWSNYGPSKGGSGILRDGDESSQFTLISGDETRKKIGLTINPDGSAFFSIGGEGAALEPVELSDLERVLLGLALIRGSGDRTLRGYIRSFSFYSEPLTEQNLLELTS